MSIYAYIHRNILTAGESEVSQRLIMKNWVMELKSPRHLTVWYLQGEKKRKFCGRKIC